VYYLILHCSLLLLLPLLTAALTATSTHTQTSSRTHTAPALPSVSPINAGIRHARKQRRVLLVRAHSTENVTSLLLLRVTSLRSRHPSLRLRDQVITTYPSNTWNEERGGKTHSAPLLLQSRSLRFLNFIHPALGDYATICKCNLTLAFGFPRDDVLSAYIDIFYVRSHCFISQL
jgi:hypothetical protein